MRVRRAIQCRFSNRKDRGYTFVEVMIVVVIVGILAAIVLPVFEHPQLREGRETALKINLTEIRLAIMLYGTHHDHYPAAVGDGCCPAMSPRCFLHHLFGPTNEDGLAVPTSGRSHGPYLMGSIPECPVGPRIGERSIEFVDSPSKLAGSPTSTSAWKYNVQTGEFICNTTNLSLVGLAYCQY